MGVARCSSGAGADATRGLRRCCTAGVFSSKGLAGDGLARRGPNGGATAVATVAAVVTAVVTAIRSTAGSGHDSPKRQNVGCTAGVFSTKGSAGNGSRQKGSTGGA